VQGTVLSHVPNQNRWCFAIGSGQENGSARNTRNVAKRSVSPLLPPITGPGFPQSRGHFFWKTWRSFHKHLACPGRHVSFTRVPLSGAPAYAAFSRPISANRKPPRDEATRIAVKMAKLPDLSRKA
jgi:hypothetical protein